MTHLKQVFFKWVTDFAPLHDVAPDGAVLCYGVAGSGFPLGDNGKTFVLSASSSGKVPAGVLTQPFVNLDETVHKKNYWSQEQCTGYPAEVIRKGVILTDLVVGSAPTHGDKAYLTSSGYITKTSVGTVQTPYVGEFQSKPDENGFVKVMIELPNA